MEFQSKTDVQIAEKMLQFPLLGEELKNTWNVELHREFNMTDDAALFHLEPEPGMTPLYEGKMIWHFSHTLAEPRYWVDVNEARALSWDALKMSDKR